MYKRRTLWNNSIGALADAITAGSDELVLQSGQGGRFPNTDPGDPPFYVLVYEGAGLELFGERVECSHRVGDTLHVAQRGVEGTSPQSWPIGSVVCLTVAAEDVLMAYNGIDSILVGEDRGDLIGFDNEGNPMRIPGGAEGAVAVRDNAETGGIRWDATFSGAVSSVFGRTGDVTAQTNDYTWAQINKTVSSLVDLTTRSFLAMQDTCGVGKGGTGVTSFPSAGLVKSPGGTGALQIATPGVDYLTEVDVDITPGGTEGSVQFNDDGALGGESHLRWDATNKRLNVGDAWGSQPFNVNNAGQHEGAMFGAAFIGNHSTINPGAKFGHMNKRTGLCAVFQSNTGYTEIGSDVGIRFQVPASRLGLWSTHALINEPGVSNFYVRVRGGGISDLLYVNCNTDRVGINTSTPSERLDVVGNIKGTNLIGAGANITSLNASNLASGTLHNNRLDQSLGHYTMDPRTPVGSWRTTLTAATVSEQGWTNSPYFENKFMFLIPDAVEYTTNGGSTWNDAMGTSSWTTTNIKRTMQGLRHAGSLNIPSPNDGGWDAVRFEFTPREYVFMTDLHMYFTTQGHQVKVEIERRDNDTMSWVQVAESGFFSGWPTHFHQTHSPIYFTTSSGAPRSGIVRITIWTNYIGSSAYNIRIHNINWYGPYPAASHNDVWDWNEDGYARFRSRVGIGASPVSLLHVQGGNITHRGGYFITSTAPTTDSTSIIIAGRVDDYIDANQSQILSTTSLGSGEPFNWYGNLVIACRTDTAGRAIHFVTGTAKAIRVSIWDTVLDINRSGSSSFDTRIRGGTDSNLLFVNASTNRVGIGKSNPSEKLDVGGNLHIDGNLTVDGTYPGGNGGVHSVAFPAGLEDGSVPSEGRHYLYSNQVLMTSTRGFVMPEDGSITSASVYLNATNTSYMNFYPLRFQVYVNGTKEVDEIITGSMAVGVKKDYWTFSTGTHEFLAGDTISIALYSTDSIMTRNVIDCIATVEVQYDDGGY